MQGVTVLVLVLISCTQNVHTQGARGVRFTLNGTTYQNNSLVTLEEIGEGDDALGCVTDLAACCQPPNNDEMGSAIGNWYFPNRTIVPSVMLTTNTSGTQWDFYVTRGQSAVFLHRRRGGEDGIYYCVIPDTVNVTQTVYIGIYTNNTDAGMAEVISVNFELISEPSSVIPTFTLTCTSTDGPATMVTWRRDGTMLNDDSTYSIVSQVVTNTVTATYTHTLTVTGRLVGEYQCTVSNSRTPSSSEMLAVVGADSPTNLTAERVNSTSIRISWIPPASGPAVTGYRIYYQTEGDQRNVGVNATEFTITSLTTSDAYNISVVALSEHLPSAVVGLEIIMPVPRPSAPNITMAVSHSPTSITLTWTQPVWEVVDSYEVSFSYQGPCGGFNHTNTTTVNDTTRQYTLTELQEFSNYTVTVTAVNGAGRSEESSVNIVTMADGTVVPTLDVTISRAAAFTAGQSYNLTCTVTLENTTRPPTVEWLGPNNNSLSSSNGIAVGDTVAVNCSTYTTTLQFTTLRTFHGGQYSCRATLGAVNNTAAVNITVLSGVWFSFKGTTYQNNSIVTLEDIGERDDALLCVTDLAACCRDPYTGAIGSAIGDWYFPNTSRVPSSGENWDFHRTRGNMTVSLHRRRGGDDGVYCCEIPDELNITQSIYIGVYTADTGLPNVTSLIYDDQSNTLTCTSTGGPATNVTWKKDGVVITLNATYQQTQIVTNTTTSTYQTVLTIDQSVNQSDIEGTYNCTVENIRGESSKTVVVPVPLPSAPNITMAVSQSPTSINLTWTQPEREVVDSYEVSFSYQGPCSGFNHTNTTTVNGTTRQYTLTGLQELSNYTVTVVAMNGSGRSEGSSQNVVTMADDTVVPTLDITISHDGGPFIAGQSYNLTCTVTLENTARPPTVEWLDPNNNPLDNNSTFTVGDTVAVNCSTYTTTLEFTTLHTFHGGQYSCQATLGAVNNTAAVNITVLSDVWFSLRGTTYQNNSLVTLEDIGDSDDAALLCVTDLTACCRLPASNATGNWHFPNRTRVPSSGNQWDFHRTRGQMVVRLHRRRSGATGIYSCEIPDAMNVLQTIYIGVYSASTGLPNVTSLIYDDQSNTLTCTSTGGPATTVTWKKDGVVITLNTTYQQTQIVTNTTTSTYQTVLTIDPSVGQSGIVGTYNCTVENIKGESSKTVVVPVQLPSAPNITMAVSHSPTSITLTWTQPEGEVVDSYEVSFSYQGPCSWFNHTNTTTVNGTTRQYTLTGLQEFSNYTVTVVAVNGAGRSEESSQNVVTMADGTVVPTLNVIISHDGGPFIAGQSYNLTCTVTLENITGTPTVEWLGPNNNSLHNNSDIVRDTVAVNCFTYTTTLQFTTLHTSHAGQYSCRATLGGINNTAALNITVQGPPPSAPNITMAVSQSPTSINLTWTQPAGEVVDSYEVSFSYQGPCSGFNHTNTTTVNGTTRQYTLTGLQEFSNYTVTVVAVNGSGRSEESSVNIVTMADDTVVPTLDITISHDGSPFIAGQSYNLICTVTLENTTRTPTVEWLNPNNNPLDNNSNITVGDTVAVNCSTYTTTLQFTTLRTFLGGQYSCQATIRAVNNTAPVNITVLIPPPSAPNITMAVSQSPTSINLTWTQPEGEVVDSYEVSFSYQGPCSGFNHTNTTTVNGTTRQYTLTGVQEFSNYTVTVVAVHGAGRSEGSSVNVVTMADGTVVPTLDITIASDHDGSPFIAGLSYNLTCTVTLENAAGTPTVEWLNPNNNPLDNNSNITVGDTVTVNCSTYTTTLEFTTLHTSHGGQYSCQATIRASSNTAAVNITVLRGVGFSLNGATYQNNSLMTLEDIGEGDDALLCWTENASCCRPPYTESNGQSAIENWFFPNGTRVPSSDNQWDFHRTRGRMVVSLHRRRDGKDGVYHCEVPDAMNIIQTIYIGVYSADAGSPNVTSLTFNSNYNTLTCTSTGGPATAVTWRKDGAVITLNATYQQTKRVVDPVAGTYQTVLSIDPSVGQSDIFGSYNCTVENDRGKSSLTVVVAGIPRVTIRHDADPPTAGESYNLTCTVTVNDTTEFPAIEWLGPNTSPLSNISSVTVTNMVMVNDSAYERTLVFSSLRTSHGGQYTCQTVLGQVWTMTSTELSVQIPPPTIFITPNHTGVLYAGTVLTLTCSIQLKPAVDTTVMVIRTWSGPGSQAVSNSSRVTVSNLLEKSTFIYETTIEFVPLNITDGGSYECEATVAPVSQSQFVNMSAAGNISLTIQALPLPNVWFTPSTFAMTGQPYSLACTVQVVQYLAAIPNVTWLDPDGRSLQRIDGTKPIRNGSGSMTTIHFTITKLAQSHTGNYTCRACISIDKLSIEEHCKQVMAEVTLSVPERVQELLLMTLSNHSVSVLWREPVNTNGAIVNYTVQVQRYQPVSGSRELELVAVDPEFNQNIPTATLAQLKYGTFMINISEGLDPLVPYRVTVVAVNLAGPGEQETMNFFTREGAPSIAPGNVEVIRLNGTAMNVSWVPLNLVEARGFVQGYIITYQQASSGSRRRRQVQTQQVDGSASYAVVGGLQSGVAYEVTVSGMTVQNGPVSSPTRAHPEPALPSPSPSPTRAQPEPTSEGSGAVIAGVIVALVIALIVILVVVIGYFLYNSRCKGEMFNKTKEMFVLTEMYELTENGKPKESGSVRPLRSSIRSKKDEADDKETDSDVEEPAPIPVPSTEVTDRMKPISVISFRDHVQQMHAESNRGFESEYQSLGSDATASLDVAKRPFNRVKNRFANILPYDFSRVKLNTIKGEEGSDYINASFVDGYNRDWAYIASQGPMPNTVSDFWRMIWEKRLPNIVMLTKCMEAGRRKCEQYWGENVGDDFETPDHKLTITTTYVLPLADFNIRTFTVESIENPDAELLRVTQYHFTSWPDHGVPKFATSLTAFIRRVQKGHNKDDGYPLLVHCSAGVGRTGTFILLDSMLERIKKEDTVNVYEFLCNMRAKRAFMVQSQPQYIFIHDALDELITCGETDILAAGLRVKVNRLRKTIPGKGITGFAEQFQLLEQVSRQPEEGDFSDGQEYYNRGKNRYPDKLPYNSCRTHLRPTGEDGSEYINASFVNGYKHQNAYIATQAPLQTTVDDFWRMIWEFKSKIIVMLCNIVEDNQEASYPYWPTKEEQTEKFGNIIVTMRSKAAYGDFTVRKFNLQDNKDEGSQSKCFQVTQFHYSEWPEAGKPPSSGGLIEMIDLLMKTQMNTGNRAITVMCNDGVGRTGTFICIYSQLERLKSEGVVDIFQSIKSARIYRAGLVPQDDQYVFCHEVLADYMDKFENYSNFKDMI